MAQFTFPKSDYRIPDEQKDMIIERLSVEYDFSADQTEIRGFSENLCLISSWEFQEGEPSIPKYTPLVHAYIEAHWPDFQESMQALTNLLWFSRTDASSKETWIYVFFNELIHHMLAIWAFDQEALSIQDSSNLNSYIHSMDCIWSAQNFVNDQTRIYRLTLDNPAKSVEQTPFRDWVFSDWIGPHLKFYRNEMVKREKEKEEQKAKQESAQPEKTI